VGDEVRMTADAWGPVASRIGGPAVPVVGPEGDHLRFSQSEANGRLSQRFWHPEGQRTNVFALSGDGQWLWMTVTITSPQLPGEARFRLRYRRASQPPMMASRDRGEAQASLDPHTGRPLPRQ
jgi:hypothetical protein